MIVPAARLLRVTAFAALPSVVLAALLPGSAAVAWAVPAFLALAALADALLCFDRFQGLAAVSGDLARLAKDRESEIMIRLRNDSGKPVTLRVGVAWPALFDADLETTTLTLPAGSVFSRFPLNCTPRERGSFRLEWLYLERASWLGLWNVRTRLPLQMELRVFPDLRRDRAAAAVFLHRGLIGLHAQRQVGKGREFEKLREYLPGDSYEDIHWKSTAKRGRPVTKTYQIERTQEVYCLVDASRLSARRPGSDPAPHGARPRTMLERYVAAAMLFGAAAEQQGDLFGLVTFAERVLHYVPAKNGKAHHDACRDAIYSLQPREISPDFEELFTFLRTTVRRRALLVFLTALDDDLLAETFVRHLPMIRRTHLAHVLMIDPEDAAPLFSKPADSTAALYQALAGHERWEHLRAVERALAVQGVRLSVTPSEELVLALLNHYLEVKRRQLL